MRWFLSALLCLAMLFGLVGTAMAGEHEVTGRMYGEHIAEHAQSGHFGSEMNPGMHQGFAGFEEHHDH